VKEVHMLKILGMLLSAHLHPLLKVYEVGFIFGLMFWAKLIPMV
jgi:hypothetical protein